MESWLKLYCPTCKSVNWVCQGDLSDLTLADIEGVCCHACDCKFKLDPDYCEENDIKDDDIDYEKGLADPR